MRALAEPLEGAAREALDGLSRALLRRSPERIGDPTLANGTAGVALAHMTLSRVHPERDHLGAATRCLEHALLALAERPLGPSLLEGYLGVAWVAQRLAPDAVEPVMARVDRPLRRELVRPRSAPNCDLFHGAAGALLYALSRDERMVSRCLDRIERAAYRLPTGIAWPSSIRTPAPRRGCQLGMAHGSAGVLSALAACAASGAHAPRARVLLEEAARWVLSQRAPDGDFPDAVLDEGERLAARTAYCRGDPGVALGLLRASEALDRADWRSTAIETAKRAARRTPREARVFDGGICHGAAGLAMIFHRLAIHSEEIELYEARDRWLGELLSMHRRGRGVGGFRVREHTGPRSGRWLSEPGLLAGAAGVALVLAAALGHDERGWDAPLGTAVTVP